MIVFTVGHVFNVPEAPGTQKRHVGNVSRRSGFTLVEMLVVITIVVILATFATIITLRMAGKDVVPRAATEIQGRLAQARTRALSEGKAHGVRLVVTTQPAPYPVPPEPPPANV